MGQLDHPNIVPVHELGIDADGRVFFTMKLVKGETLRDVFDKVASGDEGWNVTRALSVILRVCEAMAFAHSKGVLHRDIKPANIMVGRFGEVYVMDWGLARVLGQKDTHDLRLKPDESLSVVRTERRDKGSSAPDSPLITMDGTVVGTPAFMPPEQAEGRLDILGPHSDVYAIGALLYRLLSGLEPYGEPGGRLTGKQVLNRVIAGPPQPLHELAKNVPAELLAIQEKAMAREIADRYPSMTPLADDLRSYLEHRVVSAYETGAIAELKKWIERNKGLAAAAGLLVLVLAGATAIVSQQKREVDAKNLALGKANNEITTQKTEVENQKAAVEAKNVEITAQKNLVEARKAEFDQLAGKVYLERAIEREKDLYPPWPEKIEAMERWLADDAKRLLDLKPTLESTLADLRGRALPPTDEERASASDTAANSRQTFTFAVESETFLDTTLSELAASIASFESGAKADVEQRLD
jgi:eukaryotic-like serine/threonine-protein kinase